MNRFSSLAAAALLASAFMGGQAHAGRPLATEDAGILDAGSCELEGATARLSAFGAAARESSLQIGCGVGASTQLALAAATGRAEGVSARGLALSGKTGLWQGEGEGAAEIALAYGADWGKESGDGWHHLGTGVNLAYSQPLEEATAHANLGYAHDPQGGENAVTWGLAYEHSGWGAWAPMAELFGDDREAPWWNAGLRFTALPDRLSIDASYGRQIVSGRPSLWTLGFNFAF
jgi:hypothetical protein